MADVMLKYCTAQRTKADHVRCIDLVLHVYRINGMIFSRAGENS